MPRSGGCLIGIRFRASCNDNRLKLMPKKSHVAAHLIDHSRGLLPSYPYTRHRDPIAATDASIVTWDFRQLSSFIPILWLANPKLSKRQPETTYLKFD